MNPLLASVPLDNILVLLALVVVSGISAWLNKKRNPTPTEASTDENPLPPPQPREDAPGQLDLEDVLRRLFKGESPLPAPPPPASPPPPAETRDGDPPPLVASREAPPQTETRWREEAEGPYEISPARAERPVESLPQRIPQPSAKPVDLQIRRPSKPTVGRPEKPNQPPGAASTLLLPCRQRRSREMKSAVAQVLDSRTVRQAFVASLVFGPPKSLDNSQS